MKDLAREPRVWSLIQVFYLWQVLNLLSVFLALCEYITSSPSSSAILGLLAPSSLPLAPECHLL